MKKIVALILSLVLCLPFTGVSAGAYDPGFNYSNAKLVTLFLSQCTSDGYTVNTGFSWNGFANTDGNGIVIVPFFSSGGSNLFSISNSGLSSCTSLAETMADVASRLIDANSGIKIWIGTPGIDSSCFQSANSAKCLDKFTDYLTTVKSELGTSRWNANIAGVYYNQESIYASVNYSSLMSNNEIKLMNDYSYRVHTNFGKDMLWIPYYGSGTNAATIIKNIGYVANRTNIFDCVVMQSSYMDNPCAETLSNFTGICSSVDNQYVCYRDGVSAVAKLSTVNTVIGAEIECNTYVQDTYSKYVEYYSSYKGNSPLVFYWQGSVTSAVNLINAFY